MLDYWGKAEDERRPDEAEWHPLPYHSLDVAACAAVILDLYPRILDTVLRILKLPADQRERMRGLILWFVALHDLGKFANGFQRLRQDLWEVSAPALEQSRKWTYGNGLRHDSLGGALLQNFLDEGLADEDGLYLCWAYASAGHHGVPPDTGRVRMGDGTVFSARNTADARRFAQDMKALFGVDDLPDVRERDAQRASFVIVALTTVADWIGSNRNWFPYREARLDLTAYWEDALTQAGNAVRAAGVIPCPPMVEPSFSRLFPGIATPSPLQAVIEGMTFTGQSLVFIEEMTGGGKTEAADMIAAKLMACGAASGLYMALPTTTTADALAMRHKAMYERFFATGTPSFGVVHSRADRRTDARDGSITDWLSGDRRRRLIAEVCVGTVDQAMMAAMRSKFAMVRLFGLMGKVFVVDEVHSYTGYEQELLLGTVRMLGAVGASVVLMSATLSKRMKRQFAQAFELGTGFRLRNDHHLEDDGYPLVTVVDARGVQSPLRPAPAPNAPPSKRIEVVRSVAEAERLILATAATEGRCVLWVRNTIVDAIAGARSLRCLHDDVRLFHSRFPDCDRRRIETGILTRFGKDSTAAMRAGGIVVATSVVEQSLDLDFDLVVVDLKPMDVLLQAAGRGCRHPRDRLGNPLPREGNPADQRDARVVVVTPDPNGIIHGDWYESMFKVASYVYRDPGELWRTARAIEAMPATAYPHGIRPLIEAVFGSDETPEALAGRVDKAYGRKLAERLAAQPGLLNPDAGYRHDLGWASDERIPTRLGEAIEIVLVRSGPTGGLSPYDGNNWRSGCLRLTLGGVVTGTLDHGLSEQALDEIKREAGFAIPVIVEEDGSRLHGRLRGKRDRPIAFDIDATEGLVHRDGDATA